MSSFLFLPKIGTASNNATDDDDSDDITVAEHDMRPYLVGMLGFTMYGILSFVVL